MNQPLISIVVPVYNREDLVGATIGSILAQKYTHFELILVDDGSKDGSLAICNEYAEKFACISVFTQPNAGVSVARNNGIAHASGEYICFVDSDDTVSDTYLSSFVEQVQQKDYDLVISGFRNDYSNGQIASYYLPGKDVRSGKEFWENFGLLQEHNLLMGPVNKLYKLAIIRKHGLQFDASTQIAEDALFNAAYYHFVGEVSVINEPTYIVRLHDAHQGLSSRFHESYFPVHHRLFKEYLSLFEEHQCLEENRKQIANLYGYALIKGLLDAYGALQQIKVTELSDNAVISLLLADRKNCYLAGKIGQAIENKDSSYLRNLIVCHNLLRKERAEGNLRSACSVKVKVVNLAKVVVSRILYLFEKTQKKQQLLTAEIK